MSLGATGGEHPAHAQLHLWDAFLDAQSPSRSAPAPADAKAKAAHRKWRDRVLLRFIKLVCGSGAGAPGLDGIDRTKFWPPLKEPSMTPSAISMRKKRCGRAARARSVFFLHRGRLSHARAHTKERTKHSSVTFPGAGWNVPAFQGSAEGHGETDSTTRSYAVYTGRTLHTDAAGNTCSRAGWRRFDRL